MILLLLLFISQVIISYVVLKMSKHIHTFPKPKMTNHQSTTQRYSVNYHRTPMKSENIPISENVT